MRLEVIRGQTEVNCGQLSLPEKGDEDLVGDDVELLLLLALHVDRALRPVQPRDARPPHRGPNVLGHALGQKK